MRLTKFEFNNLRRYFLYLIIIGLIQTKSFGYNQNIAKEAKPLWSVIKSQLDKEPADTSLRYMKLLVRGHCEDDFQCLFDTYYFLKIQLERRFDLPAAIFICEEMLELAHQQKDLQKEGHILLELARFQEALGNEPGAADNSIKAQAIFEKIGDESQAMLIKISRLEKSLNYKDAEIVLPEMNRLLEEAAIVKDTSFLKYWHSRMINITLDYKKYKAAERHISIVEELLAAEKPPHAEYGYFIYVSMGKADLAKAENDLTTAEKHYQKALEYSQVEPDYWLQTYTLQHLSELKIEQGNFQKAKEYLAKAEEHANVRNLDDLITTNYQIKTEMAEMEEDFATAYSALQKKVFHEKKHKKKSAGFDVQRFYLEKEKEALASEKKQKELELKISEVRQRNLLIIIALSVFLATALALGFYNQRKRKKELAAQNLLIQSQSEKLQQLDAVKSQFFANVSHELRTPLSLMLAPVNSLIKENHLTEKQHKLLKMASDSGKQLEHLVNDILDLSKLEMGKLEVNEQATNLMNYFRRYLAQFESLAFQKQIDFSFETNFDKDLVANIDRSKCRQVLFNLLSNAFKFTPVEGRIRAIISMKNERLQIEVADSGRGIHTDDLPHLFDRYFQSNQANKQAEGGTGIGLALCKEYAELFGGKMEVESELGKGATFRLIYPVTLATIAQPIGKIFENQLTIQNPEPAKIEKTIIKTNKELSTILIVEDNLELQNYLKIILEEDYHVLTAENGKVALELLENPQPTTRNPQLIISDLMMPVMDGYQFLEKVKSTPSLRHIPVIMLTARAEVADRLKALRIGVDDYLLKPFLEEELVVRIENLLKNQTVRKSEAFPENNKPNRPTLTHKDQQWLEGFEKYLQKNLSKDILTVPMLAREFAMSESSLLRQLKKLTGLSPNQYLQEMRLAKARTFLENRTYYSIQKVAQKVGYNDARTFSRNFKKRFGKKPSEFIETSLSEV